MDIFSLLFVGLNQIQDAVTEMSLEGKVNSVLLPSDITELFYNVISDLKFRIRSVAMTQPSFFCDVFDTTFSKYHERNCLRKLH